MVTMLTVMDYLILGNSLNVHFHTRLLNCMSPGMCLRRPHCCRFKENICSSCSNLCCLHLPSMQRSHFTCSIHTHTHTACYNCLWRSSMILLNLIRKAHSRTFAHCYVPLIQDFLYKSSTTDDFISNQTC